MDLQLAWPCTHMTIEEVVPLDTDRRGLLTSQPIAASGSVQVLVNNALFVPSYGLSIPASLFSAVPGPYDLSVTESSLTVTTPLGSQTISFGLTGPVRWSAAAIVKELQRRGLTVASPLEDDSVLVLVDPSTVGPDSFVRVEGSAAIALGFGMTAVSDRSWRVTGRQVYPGWDLVQKAGSVVSNRYVRFQSPLPGTPVLKVSYSTTVQRCRRCQATFVENDYRFTEGGDALLIQNEDLLYQASLKILLTDLGSNPYHAWYGSGVRTRIGAKAVGAVATLISDDVRKALTKMQKLQLEQSKYQQVTPKERLYAIQGVQTKQHETDPTVFKVDVIVQNASGEPINLNIVFTVPGVVALAGTNGLTLGGR